jgi:hypothetical protein
MVFVPTSGGYYRLFFDTSYTTTVAFFQLLINVAFAALAGAIVANLSKRAFYVIGACIVVVGAGLGVFALWVSAVERARSDEIYADRLLQLKEQQYGQMDRVDVAKAHLHSAAHNWRLALRFREAKRAEQRADEVAKISAADGWRINQGATPEEQWKKAPVVSPEAGPFADLIQPILCQNMSMFAVEQSFGKPDSVVKEPGSINATEERPTVIKWFYSRYPVTDSGEHYGQPGYINFIPERFTRFSKDPKEADNIARQYGEQADSFRTYSYQGSFPSHPKQWDELGGGLGGIPLNTRQATSRNP